jgi:hypothetical protein
MTVVQNLMNKKAAAHPISSQQRPSVSSSISSSSKRTLNQFIYITFVVVVCGALIRIYVYEQDDTIAGSRNKWNNNQNDIIKTSLEEFKSNKNAKHEQLERLKRVTSTNAEPPHYHTLQCEAYGGPSEKDAQEMVYWQGTKHSIWYKWAVVMLQI